MIAKTRPASLASIISQHGIGKLKYKRQQMRKRATGGFSLWSANRDGFSFDRMPYRHVAFGSGIPFVPGHATRKA